MRRIRQADLIVNEPLPWSLYDEEGNLLLREGFVISMPKHVDSLLKRGVFVIDPNEKEEDESLLISGRSNANKGPAIPDEPSFARIDTLCLALKRVHNQLLAGQIRTDFSGYIQQLAKQLIESADYDPDGLLAAAHLDRQNPYLIVQQMLGAALCAVLSPALDLSPENRLSLICAAMTRDIGLLPIQEELDNRTQPLDDLTRKAIRLHTDQAVAMLKTQGVTDPVWLELVGRHHERNDGSGYPAALSMEQIPVSARLLGLLDSYAAIVTPRANRKAQFSANALRTLFLDKDKLYDAAHVGLLVKTLTKYPPGSIVRLANDEVAVIKRRTDENGQPEVFSVYDASGMPRMQPSRRDITKAEYAITGMLHIEECRSASLIMKRLWLKPL